MPAAAVQKGIQRLIKNFLITLVDQIIFILIAPVKAGPADVSLLQQIVDRQFVSRHPPHQLDQSVEQALFQFFFILIDSDRHSDSPPFSAASPRFVFSMITKGVRLDNRFSALSDTLLPKTQKTPVIRRFGFYSFRI